MSCEGIWKFSKLLSNNPTFCDYVHDLILAVWELSLWFHPAYALCSLWRCKVCLRVPRVGAQKISFNRQNIAAALYLMRSGISSFRLQLFDPRLSDVHMFFAFSSNTETMLGVLVAVFTIEVRLLLGRLVVYY